MRELSILEEQLLDEYMRCKRNLEAQQLEVDSLPKGNISYKQIKGKSYPYLQWTEDGHYKTKYIKQDLLDSLSKQINDRKRWELSIKNLERSIKQIEKALGRGLIKEYEQTI